MDRMGRLRGSGFQTSRRVSFLAILQPAELNSAGDDETQNANIDPNLEAARIGTITQEVHRKSKCVHHKPGATGFDWHWDELTDLGTFPEKALKGQALSHCARYNKSHVRDIPRYSPCL